MFSRAHYRRVSPARDTAAEITARVQRTAALQQARIERETLYPVITVENFDVANAYFETRYAEIMKGTK